MERDDEWDQEPNNVEQHDVLKELLGSHELEINDLSHSFQVVELKVLFVLHAENTCEMVVIELDFSVVVFLDESYLLANNNLGKVDVRVLNFNVSLLLLHFISQLYFFRFRDAIVVNER